MRGWRGGGMEKRLKGDGMERGSKGDDIFSVIKEVAKKYQVEISDIDKEKRFIPVGIVSIDWVLHGKGFPLGAIVEVFGDYSSGKSYLCYKLMSKVQREDVLCVLIDTEGSFDREWVVRCGVDLGKLIVINPMYLEEMFEMLAELFERVKESIFVVWDSLPATPSKFELKEGFDKRDLTKAQVIGQGIRLILRWLSKKDITFVIVNQLREKIGSFGGFEFTPGGRMLGYAASLKLSLRQGAKIKGSDGKVVGSKIIVECVKSKYFSPFRRVEVEFLFSKGIEWWSGLFQVLVNCSAIEVVGGGWYKIRDDSQKFREDDFYERLLLRDERVLNLVKSALGIDLEAYYGNE
ncbi:MAG: ATPase domain-containing protein [Thermoplasmatales archaeon]